MIVLNKNQQREPIGGHHYVELGRVISGETFMGVVDQVRDSRITNGRSVGNPEMDVLLFYQANWPFMVIEDEFKKPEPEPDPNYTTTRDWVFSTWKNPPKKLVTSKEATIRAGICSSCPKRISKHKTMSEEASEVERRSFMLRCGITIKDSEAYCSCHRWPIEVAIFIDGADRFSAKKDKDNVPEGCWVGGLI